MPRIRVNHEPSQVPTLACHFRIIFESADDDDSGSELHECILTSQKEAIECKDI
jgi:hypothetical protein